MLILVAVFVALFLVGFGGYLGNLLAVSRLSKDMESERKNALNLAVRKMHGYATGDISLQYNFSTLLEEVFYHGGRAWCNPRELLSAYNDQYGSDFPEAHSPGVPEERIVATIHQKLLLARQKYLDSILETYLQAPSSSRQLSHLPEKLKPVRKWLDDPGFNHGLLSINGSAFTLENIDSFTHAIYEKACFAKLEELTASERPLENKDLEQLNSLIQTGGGLKSIGGIKENYESLISKFGEQQVRQVSLTA